MSKRDCRGCYVRQMERIAEFCELDESTLETMVGEANSLIEDLESDDARVNPTMMGTLMERVRPLMGTDDPYARVKSDYNALLLERVDECMQKIGEADDPFQLALRYAAAGNLIDFGAKNEFTRDDVAALLAKVPSIEFSLDDSAELIRRLRTAKAITYLGDNCGEIVLDKILIEHVLHENPDAQVTYGVRGGPIINDVTVADAEQVGMGEVARVVPSGCVVPATDLDRSSQEFLDAYFGADVVICKGMGNYESLCEDVRRDNVFFLLMTKCDLVADILGAPMLSLVCVRNSDRLRAVNSRVPEGRS